MGGIEEEEEKDEDISFEGECVLDLGCWMDGWMDWRRLIRCTESQMIRSADLWDARTDSRFVPWNDTAKKKQ